MKCKKIPIAFIKIWILKIQNKNLNFFTHQNIIFVILNYEFKNVVIKKIFFFIAQKFICERFTFKVGQSRSRGRILRGEDGQPTPSWFYK